MANIHKEAFIKSFKRNASQQQKQGWCDNVLGALWVYLEKSDRLKDFDAFNIGWQVDQAFYVWQHTIKRNENWIDNVYDTKTNEIVAFHETNLKKQERE